MSENLVNQVKFDWPLTKIRLKMAISQLLFLFSALFRILHFTKTWLDAQNC